MTLDSSARALPAPPLTAAVAIKFFAEKRGISLRALSLEANLADATAQKIVSGESRPSLRTFALLARVLQMTPMEIWVVMTHEAAAADAERAATKRTNQPAGEPAVVVTPGRQNGKRT